MDAAAINAIAAQLDGADIEKFDDEHAIALLPPGYQAVDISKMLPPANRIKQRVELLSVAAFVAYVSRFNDSESVLFANETEAQYEAVIDYHGGNGSRGDCDHVANYRCPPSEQWTTWKGYSTKAVGQSEFAQFIENNMPDIVRPPAAEMLSVALQLQVHKAATFQSEMKLANGEVQFRYEEQVKGTSKVGDLTIPESFQIQIPVFVDGPLFVIDCRLRYRLDEGKLRMWYELVRPAEVHRAAVKEVTKSIQESLADMPFWIGKRA